MTELRPPHVKVLLATFNGATWLREQLETAMAQQGVRVSLLVSDDGSTDDTLDTLYRWAQQHHDAEILPPRGPQAGAANNFFHLLRNVRLDEDVDYVALCDQDDRWLPDRLARAIARMAEDGAAAYSSDVIAFWPDGTKRLLGKANSQRRWDHLLEPAGPGCTYVMHRELAAEIQMELRHDPERFFGVGYHDWLIYAFARSRRLRWTIDPQPSLWYRQHAHNELGANMGIAGIQRRWGRLTSGWFREQVLLIADLCGEQGEPVSRLRRLNIADRLWLAAHATDLRRRPRDQLAFAAMVLLGVLR